jgi:biotin transport system permease protein
MAELTPMGFRPGRSVPHRLDARFKLVSLAMISIVTLRADFWSLAALTALALAAIRHIGMPLRSILIEMRYFAVLLLLVFIARALSTPGTPLVSLAGISVTREGITAGGLVCWRLACVVLAGLIFIAATRPSEIRGAVIWLLAPVPWIPERRAGTMISLLVRFIPMILNQARETADAQRARCIERRKNPVVRLVKLTVALLRHIFEDADRLVVAMEARCYNEDRTGPSFSATRLDWAVLFLAAAVCGGVVFLSL